MKMQTAASAVACFLLLGLAAGCSRNDGKTDPKFDTQSHDRLPAVVLKPHKAGEEVRFVTYGSDGKTVKETRIEYVNGNTAMLHYRGDGTLRERIEHYPADKKGNRALRATTLYDVDGKTVVYDRTLYRDGLTTERTATLIGKERYELNQFQKDGKTLVHRRLVEKGKLKQDKEFRLDGTLAKLMHKDVAGVTTVTEFKEDGLTRVMTTTTPDSPYSAVKRHIFAADGSVSMEIEYTSYDITVSYLKRGTIVQKRRFSGSGWEVTVYDTNGNKLFAQKWSGEIKDKNWLDMEKPVLTEVEEFKPNGDVARRITFYPDGKTPKMVKEPAPGNYAAGTYRYFREDGTLEKEEVKESWNKITSEKTFEQKDDVKEVIPPDFFKPQPLSKPPVLSKMPIEPDYEHCGHEGC